MSTLLWLLSFMLHGVLLYAVIILYTRLAAVKETEKQQKQILEETENTLAAFLLELKEENEKLIENKASSASQSDEESQSQAFRPLKHIKSGIQSKRQRIFLNILKV